ncbi:MAG: CDP-archaeol synthase [Gammaproteobacteria bacterium]|nr:CDP-archaeol synthase [Gammaproteobacteria bacterium]
MLLILQLLILLIVANGIPIIAKNILGQHFNYPVDGGIHFFDGKPLFGKSKTIRGVVLSIIITPFFALLLGLDWYIGIIIASAAMLGDLFSSFIKRRMKMPPSSMALGIDQVPETLFPLLACQSLLNLSAEEIIAIVVIFFIVELLLSRILYKLNIRDRPY